MSVATTTTSGGVTYYHHTSPPPYSEAPPPPGAPKPILVMAHAVGPKPQPVTCTQCNREVVTRTSFKPSVRTHLMAALLFLFLCWPCVCLPYCVETCNNVNHYCPNCGTFVGAYRH